MRWHFTKCIGWMTVIGLWLLCTVACTSAPDPATSEMGADAITPVGETTPAEGAQPPAEPLIPTSTDPVFSIPGGLLEGPAALTLSLPAEAPAGAYTVYTENGAEPTGEGTRFEEAIPLLKGTDCTVIRAAVFDTDGTQLGHTVTMTYLKAGATSLRAVSIVTDPEPVRSGRYPDRPHPNRQGRRTPCRRGDHRA